jgi:hypothetical protein
MTFHFTFQLILQYRIRTGSVKFSMFVSSAVDRGFKRRSGQSLLLSAMLACDETKLLFHKMVMVSTLCWTNTLSLNCFMLTD